MRVTQASCEQRAGRAGRVRPGCYLLFGDVAEPREPHVDPTSIDTIAIVNPRIASDPMFPCATDPLFVQHRRDQLLSLFPGNDAAIAIAAIAKLPCSVKHAAILQHAKRNGLVIPAALLIACIDTETWPKEKTFTDPHVSPHMRRAESLGAVASPRHAYGRASAMGRNREQVGAKLDVRRARRSVGEQWLRCHPRAPGLRKVHGLHLGCQAR